MKIIFSPTKTFKISNSDKNKLDIKFMDKTSFLVKILKSLSLEDLKRIMKIKGKTLDHVIEIYKKFDIAPTSNPINSYNGISFKQLEIDTYNKAQIKYLEDHLSILSALYGVLEPFDQIKEYRLDMNMKILDSESLYSFWAKEINDYFKNEDLIINLASKEFSKMIKKDMITIDFRENKNGIYKSISTYAKKGRGLMLNYMIKNNIKNIEDIKKFDLEGYKYNKELSDNKKLVFCRRIEDN